MVAPSRDRPIGLDELVQPDSGLAKSTVYRLLRVLARRGVRGTGRDRGVCRRQPPDVAGGGGDARRSSRTRAASRSCSEPGGGVGGDGHPAPPRAGDHAVLMLGAESRLRTHCGASRRWGRARRWSRGSAGLAILGALLPAVDGRCRARTSCRPSRCRTGPPNPDRRGQAAASRRVVRLEPPGAQWHRRRPIGGSRACRSRSADRRLGGRGSVMTDVRAPSPGGGRAGGRPARMSAAVDRRCGPALLR